MEFSEISQAALEKIKQILFDRIYEKHGGSWKWSSWLEYDEREFIEMQSYDVLLPINKQHHINITPLRVIPSANAKTLTVFFEDTTYGGGSRFDAGFLAICEKIADEGFTLRLFTMSGFLL